MRDSALFAEHAMLTERMVPRTQIGPDWVYLARPRGTLRTSVLKYLGTHTTGKFVMLGAHVIFEKEEDAIMYNLAFSV